MLELLAAITAGLTSLWNSPVGKALFHPLDFISGPGNNEVQASGGIGVAIPSSGGIPGATGRPMALAAGIRRVLSDGYYRLHEGENVSQPYSKFLSNEANESENKFSFGDIRITLQGSGNSEEDARRIARLVKEQIEAEMARTYRSK